MNLSRFEQSVTDILAYQEVQIFLGVSFLKFTWSAETKDVTGQAKKTSSIHNDDDHLGEGGRKDDL